MTIKLTDYDPADFLTSADDIAAFMADARATNDPAYIAGAKSVVERARVLHSIDVETGVAIVRPHVNGQ